MLNVQTEHLENHTVRLTVEIDPQRLEQAMQKAARRISQKGVVPGFRPGKAPYNVVLKLYGYEYVMAEAIDNIGQSVYVEALEAAQIEPYAMGSIEDVQDQGRKVVFVVPKQPAIDLGDYRAVRAEAEPVEVTDDMVTEAMENLRQNSALLEPADRAAKLGDMVTFDHIMVAILDEDDDDDDLDDEDEDDDEDEHDEEEKEEKTKEEADDDEDDDDDLDDEDDDEDDEEDEDEHGEDYHYDEEDDESDVLVHEHNFDRVLRDDKDDMFPGFSAKIEGMNAGEHREFELEIPADAEIDERIKGKRLFVDANLSKVQARTVPEWSDDLAKRISNNKIETMIELRVDTRKKLLEAAENMEANRLATVMMEKITESASVKYPEELVQDYISDMMAEIEQNLLQAQHNLSLKDYLRISGLSEEKLRETYREAAIKRATRALVMRQFVQQEQIVISSEEIDAEIARMIGTVDGEQAQWFQQFLSTPQSRQNIGADMMTSRAVERLAAIARGENPPAAAAEAASAPAEQAAQAETPVSAETPAVEETPAAEETPNS